MTITEIESQAFEQFVERWVLHAIASGVGTFNQLVKALPSVDPIIIAHTLRRLSSNSTMPQDIWEKLNTSASQTSTRIPYSHYQIGLPLPHPLDFDWRFTDGSVEYLLKSCETLTNLNDTIVLLGAPSLFRGGLALSWQRRMILLEANKTMTNYLTSLTSRSQVMRSDLLNGDVPRLSGAAVVMDPPWYFEHIQSFLWAACQICQLGGHIFVSLPPVGTRPGINQEWKETLVWAKRLGLKLVHREDLSLSYLTPVFERNAFRVAGLPAIEHDWRRGDLAIFQRVSSTQVSRPGVAQQQATWSEVSLLGVRIRVRPWTSSEFENPKLVPILPGNVLTSVSRRDSRRQLADVWTSGNRVFICQGRGILWHVLQAISTGDQPHAVVEAFLKRSLDPNEGVLIAEVTNQILSLISLEQKENLLFNDYWNDTNLTLAAS